MVTPVTDKEAADLRALAAQHAAEDTEKHYRPCRCDACYFARHGELP